MRQAIILITIAATLGGAGTLALANAKPAKAEIVESGNRPSCSPARS